MHDTIFFIVWIVSGIGAFLIWRAKGGPALTGLGLGCLGMFGLIVAIAEVPRRRVVRRSAGGRVS
jgi:hypothetical protein